MIQNGTFLNVIDNSGAKTVFCIKVLSGYRKRYAGIGDKIIISVKKLRLKRRAQSKVKKGDIFPAIIVRTKVTSPFLYGDKLSFSENSVVLLNKQNKLIGTRIFGVMPKSFRYSKYLKLISLSSGIAS
jgi:large subunit ribosomal protein L14